MDRKSWWGYVLLGIIAAAVVPLFLNTISSNLLETGQSNWLIIFIFFGFCLIAALFSRSFLESMYSRVIRQAKKAEDEALEVKGANSEPDEPENDRSLKTELLHERENLTENENKILYAFGIGKYTFRSFSGLKSETALSKDVVQSNLDSLVSKELIVKTFGNDRQCLWYLTLTGKKLVGLISK